MVSVEAGRSFTRPLHRVLDRLRSPLCARMGASMLVLGIALAWAAPARAARAWESEWEQVQATLASSDAQRISAALAEASLRAATPEAFASEVVRALAAQRADGRVSPATDALLRALFGRILQAMALGRTVPAVIGASSLSDGPVPQAAVEMSAVRPESDDPVIRDYVAPARAVVPAVERPQIQSQGP